jgi:Secretion system C-terminal sorting domain/PKD domain
LLRQGDTSMPTSAPVNVPPTVSAGSPQTITLPTSSVTLTGTATGNGGATISSTDWTQVSGPGTAAIGSASSLSTGVSGLVAGTYVFKLTATDDNNLTATSIVTITVNAAVPPPPAHVPPVANAGPDQTISLPFTDLTLDGSGSYDTDGTIVSYNWVELSGDGGVTIVNSSQAEPTIYGLIAGTYVFQLTVTDNTGASATATVTITVSAAVTPPPPPTAPAPVANAGRDTTIALPASSVELDGSGSTDPSGETLSYQWTEQSGPGTAAIAFSGSATTTVSGLQPGLYIFKLTVTNSSGQSATATVQVRVVNDERQSDSGNAQVLIYPNPVETTLNVKFTDVNTNGQVLLKIFDMKGRLVMGQQVAVSGGDQVVTFNVSGLAIGTYALQVIVGTKQTYQLIVKQ